MKAVILAAGMGTRLRPRTDYLPKGLIEIHGQTLLERSLSNLAASGIQEAYVVTGFRSHLIRQQIGERCVGVQITYVDNPRFSETGSMASLSQLRDRTDEDILLLESDLLYQPAALEQLIGSPHPDVILIAALLNAGDDVYVCTNGTGHITHLGKKLSEAQRCQAAGCLVGISKLSPAFLEKLFAQAEREYATGQMNAHYEECILSTSHATGHPVFALFSPNLVWTEIDTENDLQRAIEEILPKL